MLCKRIGVTLKTLENKGTIRQSGHVEGLIGWIVAGD